MAAAVAIDRRHPVYRDKLNPAHAGFFVARAGKGAAASPIHSAVTARAARIAHFPIVHGWVGERVSQTFTLSRKLAHTAVCSAVGSNL
jgi:hypothetical protein